MLKKLLKNKRGFTLVELIVVIAILGILAAVMIPLVGGFIEDARVKDEINTINTLMGDIALRYETGGYTQAQLAVTNGNFSAAVLANAGLTAADVEGFTITNADNVITIKGSEDRVTDAKLYLQNVGLGEALILRGTLIRATDTKD